jgi:hypothetical protein
METVVSTIKFPCKYSTSGCAVSPLYAEKREHEKSCEFGPYSCQCPLTSCEWQGSLEQVVTHLYNTHKLVPSESEGVKFLIDDINGPQTDVRSEVLFCFEHYFVIVIRKHENVHGDEEFCVIVQLVGSREQAENFAYRLELNGQGKFVTWEGTTVSICEEFSAAIMNPNKCSEIDLGLAQYFVNNGNLDIDVIISVLY